MTFHRIKHWSNWCRFMAEGTHKTRLTKRLGMILSWFTLALLDGCASYRNRVADDFRDTVKMNVGVGCGIYARAKATSFMDAGAGWFGYSANLGLEDRYTSLIHSDINSCFFPLLVIPQAISHDSPWAPVRLANIRLHRRLNSTNDYAVAGQVFDWKAVKKWEAYGVEKQSLHEIIKNGDTTYTDHPCGFEAGVGAILVNVNVGFDPVEFGDLICTIFGFDLLKDERGQKQKAGTFLTQAAKNEY